jgi:hypothetical protein
LLYFTDIGFQAQFQIKINYGAVDTTHQWYQLQVTQTKKVKGVWYCGRDTVKTLLPRILSHEGTDPPNAPYSHVVGYNTAVARVAPSRYEKFVSGVAHVAQDEPALRALIADSATAYSNKWADTLHNPFPTTCIFVYPP